MRAERGARGFTVGRGREQQFLSCLQDDDVLLFSCVLLLFRSAWLFELKDVCAYHSKFWLVWFWFWIVLLFVFIYLFFLCLVCISSGRNMIVLSKV